MDEQLIRDITIKVLGEMTMDNQKTIPVGVSARHVHLCRENMDILFGKGSELTFHKELMGGQYAAQESVIIVGRNPNASLKARVLGPLRSKTQVEVSLTDSRALGILAPLRDSGDINGSESITLIGPNGAVYLKHGCIAARRHIHMSPADALQFGVKDADIMKVQIDGPRGGIFDNVLIRVDKTFTLEMHIDTDETNALGVSTRMYAQLIGGPPC